MFMSNTINSVYMSVQVPVLLSAKTNFQGCENEMKSCMKSISLGRMSFLGKQIVSAVSRTWPGTFAKANSSYSPLQVKGGAK